MSEFTDNQGLVLPEDTDLGDVVSALASYNTGVESRLVQRYGSAVDRSVRNPAPNKGEISYLNDVDAHERYDGTNWRNLRGGVDHSFLPGEMGTVLLSFTNQIAFYQTVSFVTAFVQTPMVFTNIATTASVTGAWTSRAYNVSTNGFNVFVENVNDVAATWSNVQVQWVAIGQQ